MAIYKINFEKGSIDTPKFTKKEKEQLKEIAEEFWNEFGIIENYYLNGGCVYETILANEVEYSAGEGKLCKLDYVR